LGLPMFRMRRAKTHRLERISRPGRTKVKNISNQSCAEEADRC
jgi:hypothetical protein